MNKQVKKTKRFVNGEINLENQLDTPEKKSRFFCSHKKWKVERELAKKKAEEKAIKEYESLELKSKAKRLSITKAQTLKNRAESLEATKEIRKELALKYYYIEELTFRAEVKRLWDIIKSDESKINSIVRFCLSDYDDYRPKTYSEEYVDLMEKLYKK
jgi:hypothetical protein